jgi:hypothetical protein
VEDVTVETPVVDDADDDDREPLVMSLLRSASSSLIFSSR